MAVLCSAVRLTYKNLNELFGIWLPLSGSVIIICICVTQNDNTSQILTDGHQREKKLCSTKSNRKTLYLDISVKSNTANDKREHSLIKINMSTWHKLQMPFSSSNQIRVGALQSMSTGIASQDSNYTLRQLFQFWNHSSRHCWYKNRLLQNCKITWNKPLLWSWITFSL